MQAGDFVQKALLGEIPIEEHTAKIIGEAEKKGKEHNCFTVLAENEALQRARELDRQAKKGKAKGKLFGLPVSVKDNICVKGIESRAGSKILSGYKPLFNATAVQRMLGEGAVIIGKTSMDEFGFGSFSKNTGIGFKRPLNPFDKKRVCGGSSGGSACFTRLAENAHLSLAESTGGSIAAPASFCGVFGLTPTYGRVSRYGLIDYASSLDKIGLMAKAPADTAVALSVIAGQDACEPTTFAQKNARQKKTPKKTRVGIVKELFEGQVDEEVKSAVEKKLGSLPAGESETKEVSMPTAAKYGVSAYYILAMTEASTNLAKYCGMRYGLEEQLEGSFNEYFTRVRTGSMGKEAKLRTIIGTFARSSGFRDAYYLKAAKARTRIIAEYKGLFKEFDFLVSPAMPVPPMTFEEADSLTPMQNYAMDSCTAPANLAGIPHFSINAGRTKKGLPIGLMAAADHFEEESLLGFAEKLEESS